MTKVAHFGVPLPKKEEEPQETPGNAIQAAEFEDIIMIRNTIPLWERWSPEWLMKRREELGARGFDRGYRQRAIADEDLTWRADWVDAARDREIVVEDYIGKHSRWASSIKHGGVDLAVAAEDKSGAFFVIAIIAIDAGEHRYVLWIERHRGLTFGEQVKLVAEVANRFQVDKVAVESVGYQNILTRELALYSNVPVEPFHTEAKHKLDTLIGIPSLATEFEHHRWHLPYGDARSQRMMDPFIEEMKSHPLPGYNDDIIMATYFARESYRTRTVVRPRLSVIRF